MKTASKVLVLALCAILLVSATILGTMAYLTSQDTVTNTFTVGSVSITLDETEVNPDGTAKTPANRNQANTYKLMPGHEYTKDPVIHVGELSEDCWVFVKVENEIAAIEAAGTEKMKDGTCYVPIAEQITQNGWTALEEGSNVYYKQYTKDQADKDLKVFANFMISGKVDNDTLDAYAPKEADDGTNVYKSIVVTGYAVQKDGFATAKAAWDETFGAPASAV